MPENNKASWLHLLSAPGLGFARITQLLNHFGTAAQVVAQKSFPPEFNIPSKALHHLNQASNDDIAQELAWLEKANNHLLTIDDPLYPPQLKQISDPPVALYVKGNTHALLLPQLAVVGSRHASQGGLKNAHAFCHDLAKSGLVITSGLAAGIDTQAHQGALDAAGQTIAVMGTGINSIYPKSNQSLAKVIANQGAVVSEFPLNTPPHAYNFPQRNRIIAGLSLGTLVVEAASKSGTLITARLSVENNRPVMAIPGSIHNPLSKGCHQLIKQGAKLVESAQDIMEELSPSIDMLSDQLQFSLDALDQSSLELNQDNPNIALSETQKMIFNQLDFNPTSFDAIVNLTELSSAEVASDLLIMELSGLVEKLPGAKYQKS
ncbi:DNA-processing protein DprA [Marinicella litoralis]|uniref:DNA protecting protein DprA n=1 Tax=Marinicella litoralis TaxID=644220 RepID=A0A4R6XZ22_9GAMM|nr:DNA-processing protein DprA [Marinicella litoralis]TDR23790.1 DNA protecting protein DprA [Marinicella litoralis]